MGIKSKSSLFLSAVFGAAFVFGGAFATAPVNPRESSNASSSRVTATNVSHRNSDSSAVNVTRVAAGNGRAGALTTRAMRGIRGTRGGIVSRSGFVTTGRATAARTATAGVARSAVAGKSNRVSFARAGKNVVSGAGVARSAKTARATAIFSDVSKIGGGYSACRESYATCMDQMCAVANDTYRRCFCSDRFTNFRNTELALDQAMTMLRQFEDNNLNAVDKTAAEVSAMYSATVGEQAIKKDTSAAQQVLDSIGDLLSGKTKPNSNANSSPAGLMDFSADLDDIWGNNSNSIFGGNKTQDMSELEGAALFASAQQQCVRLSQGQCDNDAVFNMAKSSYNILISQDCNLYEKTLNKKKENVSDAVRQAEKILRDSRLEEYRSHNSADVNECIDKVRTAILSDVACGENYKRCLDPTGAYISASTGEPILTPKFFQLEDLIVLNGSMDIASQGQNGVFLKYLDNYRQRAASALDTCRDQAEYVWNEFKNAALIEIAQSQAEKIEEVKSSCVSTIADCYDTQTDGLKQMDTTERSSGAAAGRYAAADMCKEKVVACAALYGGSDCKFDDRGKLKNGDGKCGLKSLLNFVSTVDTVKVAELCAASLKAHLQEVCAPAKGDTEKYPWGCRAKDVSSDLYNIAQLECKNPAAENGVVLDKSVTDKIEELVSEVADDLDYMLSQKCEEVDGYWYSRPEGCKGSSLESDDDSACKTFKDTSLVNLSGFYTTNFSKTVTGNETKYGRCVVNDTRAACLGFNTDSKEVATYNKQTDDCEFKDGWYEDKCRFIGGIYKDGVCYVP